MGKIENIKKEILEVSKMAYNQGLMSGTSGNLSAYIREENKVIITPSSIRYSKMKIEDLVVIDIEGNIIEGHNKPSSEWQMHCIIYKEKKDVNSIFHTHSPYATSFAVNRIPIPLILIEMIPFLGGEVPLAEIALPGSEEMGYKALEVLGDKNACLLSNHGTLAVGDSVDQSYIRAEYIEDAAKIYHFALNSGEIHLIPDQLVEKMISKDK